MKKNYTWITNSKSPNQPIPPELKDFAQFSIMEVVEILPQLRSGIKIYNDKFFSEVHLENISQHETQEERCMQGFSVEDLFNSHFNKITENTDENLRLILAKSIIEHIDWRIFAEILGRGLELWENNNYFEGRELLEKSRQGRRLDLYDNLRSVAIRSFNYEVFKLITPNKNYLDKGDMLEFLQSIGDLNVDPNSLQDAQKILSFMMEHDETLLSSIGSLKDIQYLMDMVFEKMAKSLRVENLSRPGFQIGVRTIMPEPQIIYFCVINYAMFLFPNEKPRTPFFSDKEINRVEDVYEIFDILERERLLMQEERLAEKVQEFVNDACRGDNSDLFQEFEKIYQKNLLPPPGKSK